MSYSQFGYTYPPASQLLVSGQGTTPCCDSNRATVTDPLTGQSVCSCQYDSRPLAYPRFSSAAIAGAVYNSPYTDQTYSGIGIDSSAFYSPLGNPYGFKENSSEVASLQGLTQTAGYYSYDPTLAAYGYGGYDLNARRKNATRETTATLKAWLNEHKKNPYPTKGEKIMLAIITKMTLTQVSTWFANARRRLKKENKMTWEPKNKCGDDDGDASDLDDSPEIGKNTDCRDESEEDRKPNIDDVKVFAESDSELASSEKSEPSCAKLLRHGSPTPPSCARRLSSPPPPMSSGYLPGGTTVVTKPKIWSIADTATCKTPPPPPPAVHPADPGPSPQTWVPSLAAFPVPPTLHAPPYGSHQLQSEPRAPLPPNHYGGLSLGGRSVASHYSEPHTDTPPQTPPNMKLPSGVSPYAVPDCLVSSLSHQSGATYPSSTAATSQQRSLLTTVSARLHALQGDRRETSLNMPGNQPVGPSNLYNTESSATAFKPVYKSSVSTNDMVAG